ncbi:MAG: YebC/PmpR family DNA-binding transcriptional regulator [Armatimonadetes bacterium CG_4_10_14_3_um_filter_66_18]|nr:YebC/PmpR family DNA-binding transcriptional regulator [Armatimonadota bacterium]OIP05924.1 MAG: transcriptional regulator [Armatimonadetes bacterium CG2_30_66_41]PIU92553.1 MAG: YebC/PmpR family DNA-binding transcriptional regulator [Armatimonadetes bacterium CG06_land_8_20_14_3_00_66_21]PIX45356.1 MAG: YebC/PmpR family DNA-binding transcriptional regulator [Armatimonadetes bacterium CG_4_8_14_3_um_filter_66_20]PIY52162.1 MAG: YebC/PmpR family DNA-binding transcriptional regulator [Armatimo
MSGHSKWHNIRLRKEKVDSQKGKLFGKIAREITVAAKNGVGDPAANPRLRLTIQKAKEAGMPNDNIERAINRGTGELDGTSYEESTYEGYGPGGVAVLIETLTDNRNRTVADIRSTLTRHGGNLGENGCVAWNFEKKGIVVVEAPVEAEEQEQVMEVAIDAGAEDVEPQEGAIEVTTSVESFETVSEALTAADLNVTSAELSMVPNSAVPLEGDEARRMVRLMHALEDLDDVQSVSANFDVPDDILEETEGG